MAHTNKEIKMTFTPLHNVKYDVVIPKGTLVTHMTAMGVDKNYNFIADLSWIPLVNDIKQYGLIHDATYHGILVNKEDVDEDEG